MNSFIKALLVAAATLAVGGSANAGLQAAVETPSVTSGVVNGQFTGKIIGTMRAFRNSPDPNAYANLRVRLDGTIVFSAQLNGTAAVCFFPDTYDAQYAAAIAGDMENGKFTIFITGALCSTSSTIDRGSQHPSYSAPN